VLWLLGWAVVEESGNSCAPAAAILPNSPGDEISDSNNSEIIDTKARLNPMINVMPPRQHVGRPFCPAYCAAVIIRHDREPGLHRFAIRPDEQNIKWRMIGLPNGIRASRFTPVNQVECFAVGLRALVG
jgi:hypothetical protein